MSPFSTLREIWTVQCYDNGDNRLPITVFSKHLGGSCLGSQTRLNYTREEAKSFVEYLNSRPQP